MLDENKRSAIIIDDEENIVEVLKAQLESMKLFKHVISANDGLIALNKIHNQDFSLIILDLNLPKKNGLEIVSKLIEENQDYARKILVVSGDIVKKSLEHLMRLGVKNFLIKPFNNSSLELKIQKMLEKTKSAA
jgi:response regulator of citrate/malate metabolism